MTPTISPTVGTMPQTAASSCSSLAPVPYSTGTAPASYPSTAAAQPGAVAATTGGGAIQAVEGVAAIQGTQGAQASTAPVAAAGQVIPGTTVTPEQLIPVLQNVVAVINQLIPLLQQQQSTSAPGTASTVAGGGGGGGAHCAMPNCPMNDAIQGAMGAPRAAGAEQASAGAGEQRSARRSGAGSGAAPAAGPAGTVDPSTVKDKASTNGLRANARKGLEVAHTYGLPLVSGHRTGGSPKSDHPHGNAIDVSTIAIGSPSSTQGTPQMQAYAEHMRQQGKAGAMGVTYVIHNGKIASPRENWAWRDYTYPGESPASLEEMKHSDRGKYNRIQHYDHVHVSFS